MKKCLFCKKKTRENEFICDSCKEFLKWKYRERYRIHIEKIKDYFSKPIKFRRAK